MHRASLRRQILKLALLLPVLLARPALAQSAAAVAGPWDEPAASLAAQIADLLGPGPAHLTLRNLSSIPTGEIPAIRRLLEKDLQARGVQAASTDAANSIRLTLSEDLRERLWVAEIIEGSETHVAMVRVPAAASHEQTDAPTVTLRAQSLLTVARPVLAALESGEKLIVVEADLLAIYAHSSQGWSPQGTFPIAHRRPAPRDPRAVVVSTGDGLGFHAALAGIACTGTYEPATEPPSWNVQCRESDDPWPIAIPAGQAVPASLPRAFANAGRDYFTGVVTPSLGVDLPPFYDAAAIPRPDGAGLLINGIDGKVQIADAGTLKPVSGTRDWGSDFAVLPFACAAGPQVIASGSGEALTDSLRAFALPGFEAIPSSAPLTMAGTVTALFSAGDGKSVIAIVRKPAASAQPDEYEVDRVTANCN